MNATPVLSTLAHRPYPLPTRPWFGYQEWNELLFQHHAADLESLRKIVPASLEIDTFEGRPWVGIVPFCMANAHLRSGLKIPGTVNFAELNLRTYVYPKGDRSRPGVYFFTLEAHRWPAVLGARVLFGLPYHWAHMKSRNFDETIFYESRRYGNSSVAYRAKYRPVAPIQFSEAGSLEHWFTERYCLYVDRFGSLYRGDIHHRPWPLQKAEAEVYEEGLSSAYGIKLASEPPTLHYARKLKVYVWAIKKVK